MSNLFYSGKKALILVLSIFPLPSPFVAGEGQEEANKTSGNELPRRSVIEDVPYIPMYSYWSTCAMTSLKMAVSYYGYDYSVMTLINLGWRYGATLVENEAGKALAEAGEKFKTF